MRIFIFLVVVAGAALADEATDKAKEHYLRGTKLYDLQRYLDAAHEYEKAYELRDEPALLFNIGQAYRLGGDAQRAIGAYRSYLRRVPESPNRASALQLIEDLKKSVETQKKPPTGTLPTDGKTLREEPPPPETPAQQPPPPPVVVKQQQPPPPAPPPDRRPRTLLFAGIGVGVAGVALLAVGGAFAGLTANIANDINHPAQGASYDKSLEDRGRTYQSASIATFALGGALAVTGVVLIGVSRRRPAKLALGPGPGDAGLLLSGSFQ